MEYTRRKTCTCFFLKELSIFKLPPEQVSLGHLLGGVGSDGSTPGWERFLYSMYTYIFFYYSQIWTVKLLYKLLKIITYWVYCVYIPIHNIPIVYTYWAIFWLFDHNSCHYIVVFIFSTADYSSELLVLIRIVHSMKAP